MRNNYLIMEFPFNNGICLICDDKNNCPMTKMLHEWREFQDKYGENIPSNIWDEYSIDEPDVVDGEITWCPMHHVCGMPKVHKITHAAYIRNDGVTTKGKSHADIIKICPYGTCKEGSVSGFIDNKRHFVDRETAYEIALAAGQLQPEKMRPKNRKYLLSEDIWSNVSNGDYDYDEKQGYVLK